MVEAYQYRCRDSNSRLQVNFLMEQCAIVPSKGLTSSQHVKQ